jgi:cobalt/nickel transport system permease protein
MKLRGRKARFALLGWLIACFTFSAITDPLVLSAGIVAVVLVFPRQTIPAAKRTLVTAAPVTLAILSLTWAHAWWILHVSPNLHAYAALALRAGLLAFGTFAVLGAVDLMSALAPWPTLSRLLVVTLAQIHALRLLARESWLGLQSRLPRKPSARDGLANAGGVTATMLTLSARNAREISEALRSRGF